MQHLVCEHCGKAFTEAHNHRARRFCSPACMGMAKRGKVERTCELCGKHFMAIPSNVAKGLSRFCSKKCKGLAMRTVEERACLLCGRVFRPRVADGQYCSRQCMGAAFTSSVERPCDQCGKMISVKPVHLQLHTSHYCSYRCMGLAFRTKQEWVCEFCGKTFAKCDRPSRPPKHRFCSDVCQYSYYSGEHAVNWQGGITPEWIADRGSKEYQAWRRAVLKRDQYTCRRCGVTHTMLHAHHLYSFLAFPNLRFDIANGHALCQKCHREIQNKEGIYLRSIGMSPAEPPLFMYLSEYGR